MPDQSEVEAALVRVIASALEVDRVGVRCAAYRGWPESAALEAALQEGAVHVTVFPGAVRDATRFLPDWRTRPGVARLGVTVTENRAAFSGVAGPGEAAGLLVDGRAYAYRAAPGDTAELVAAILAAEVRTERIAHLHGVEVSVPGAVHLAGRAVADGSGALELRRQRQMFRVTAWCPGPEVRDRVCSALDLALAGMRFLDVAGEACGMQHASGATSDQHETAGLYRRDLTYTVEYPTVAAADFAAMLFGTLGLNGANHII